MSSLKDVFVPDIGDFKNIPVIEVLVKPGDLVHAEDSIITLESDKATMEVPAPSSGVVKEIKVSSGDSVSEGTLILSMEASADNHQSKESVAQMPVPYSEPVAERKPGAEPNANHKGTSENFTEKVHTQKTVSNTQSESFHNSGTHASPGVRRLARELGVDLSKVSGTGKKNRILKEDVQAYIKKSLSDETILQTSISKSAKMPQIDFAKFGKVEQKDLSRIKKISGPILHRNWVEIPHITQHHDADITELENFRKQIAENNPQVKITPIAFIIKALSIALTRHPDFNSSLKSSGKQIIVKKYINIGIAVDTPHGLVVPVIKDVIAKGVITIASELQSIGEKARNGKLSPKDMEGGTFSVSSLGGIGGGHFTPIINAPEVAILGVNRALIKPIWTGSEFSPRKMLPISLSYDHRVIDGAEGSRFIVDLAELLTDLRNALL